MYRRLAMTRRLSHFSLPLVLLAVVSVLSVAARAAWLGQPCRAPCRSASDHLLIFDEAYYVNAARVIAGIAPAAGQKYAGAPLGDDPNSEHPQLAKLVIAGSIELFGDDPLAWRLGSIVLGSVAILGMFALVRSAGGGDWLAVGAAALMAGDALLLVHGRIGTLDVYVLPAMIWGVVLYLRGRPIAGGAVIGIGSCIKLVAPYALAVLVLFEGLRLLRAHGRAGPIPGLAARLGACAASGVVVFVGLLAILDRIAPPYDATTGKLLAAGPFHHIAHMFSYAANQTSPHGPTGIASYPWQWLVDYKPITYLNINPEHPSPGLTSVHPAAHFVGMISPPVMLLAIPALGFIAWEAVRGARRGGAPSSAVAPVAGEVPILGLAWFLGTFVPFELLSVFWSRTSYLYYMVVVMPGIYLAVGYLVLRARRYRRLVGLWMFSVLVAAILMYPFTPLP